MYFFSCFGSQDTKKFRFFPVSLFIFLETRYWHSLETSVRVCGERSFFAFSHFLGSCHEQEVLHLLFWAWEHQKVSIFPSFSLHFPGNAILTLVRHFCANLVGAQFFRFFTFSSTFSSAGRTTSPVFGLRTPKSFDFSKFFSSFTWKRDVDTLWTLACEFAGSAFFFF